MDILPIDCKLSPEMELLIKNMEEARIKMLNMLCIPKELLCPYQ